MHKECEQCFQATTIHSFPLADKMVHYQILFEKGFEGSDCDYLFEKYVGEAYSINYKTFNWSILVFIDEITEFQDLQFVLPLVDEALWIIGLFDEFIVPFLNENN